MIGRRPSRNEADVYLAELVARRHPREAASVTSNAKNTFGGKIENILWVVEHGSSGGRRSRFIKLFTGCLPKGRRCLFMITQRANHI